MHPTVASLTDRTGIELLDPIQNARFELRTPTAVTPTTAPTEEFYFPVDSAATVETSAIRVPKLVTVYARTQTGDFVADNTSREDLSLAPGGYSVEVSTAPMKLYLSVESGVEIRHDEQAVTLDFDGPTEVAVGARSFHDHPAGTITTTDDPVGAMRAVSYLGSALKTTSPERSFPTLRGHPPLVEVGDEFDVPEGIDPPDTGVRLEVPAEYEYVYPASSLAYYLGAEVVPADRPRLVTDAGFEYDLDGPLGYEQTVGRVLQQVFFLDCVTRTEGYYDVDLHERNAVESDVSLDFAALYDQSLAERLEAYLSVPFEAVADHVPEWNLTTDVLATGENVEVLPFVAADLALVRCPDPPTVVSVSPTPEPLDEFFRSDPSGGASAEDFTRSTTSDPPANCPDAEIFNPDPAETVEHAWVGDGFPLGANKATVESYRRRIGRSAPDQTAIDIHVVCNDERMQAEGVVEEFYGLRDLLRFDVSVHYELTTDELRDLLAESSDFLHYVGHVDENGVRCADGHLDARTLSDVNASAFVLNACRSYEQGAALVEAGSYGGVVTLAEIANSVATDVGQTLARLLNCGFSLRTALAIVKDVTGPAYQYVTIGDGGLTLCQSESGVPVRLRVERVGDDRFEVGVVSYPVPEYGLGSLQQPHVAENETQYLTSGHLDTFELSGEQLDRFLDMETYPVEVDGDLYWSDETTVDDL